MNSDSDIIKENDKNVKTGEEEINKFTGNANDTDGIHDNSLTQKHTEISSTQSAAHTEEPEKNTESLAADNVDDNNDEDTETPEEYLDILGNGLLKKKILVKGNGKKTRPERGDVVTLDIEGHLADGTAVDKHNSFSFYLGEGDVIQAWDLAVSLMEDGETSEIFTGYKFAYGDIGRDPDIPPKSDITYTIELLKSEPKPELDQITTENRLNIGEKKRERGNFLFTRQDYTGAINSYTQAIKTLDHPGNKNDLTQTLSQQISDCKLKCCNNLAACQLKVEAYEAAIRSTELVLLSQPNNVKALFRIGKAHSAKGNTTEGISYFKKALKLEPESKIIHQELSKLSKKLQSETELEKEMYKRMLGGQDWKSPNKKSGSSWVKWTAIFGGLTIAGLSIAVAIFRGGSH